MTDGIVVVDPDPRWPALFEAEAARIRAAAGGLLVALEHVGSTAVPGLAAKPVIDILGGVRSLAGADALVPRIVSIGYEYVSRWEDELPGRRYFVRRAGGVRTHHLHVVEVASAFWTDHLLFRDHLRRRPADAARYAALKRDLADEFGEDREAYTDAKAEFISACLAAARAETGSRPGGENEPDSALPRSRRHAIVVGGTGMLRGASLGLADRGFAVSVVAHDARRLAGLCDEAADRGGVVRPVRADWHDAAAFASGIDGAVRDLGPPSLAVVWAHSSAPDAPFAVARVIDAAGRRADYVHVLGSAAADPSRDDDGRAARFAAFRNVAYREVILGFVVLPHGSRWLTNDEIAHGVLRAVDSGAPRTIVGVVEPWPSRP